MLDHASIGVSDLERSAAFYDTVLSVFGYERRKERPGAIGYGPPSQDAAVFWILDSEVHSGRGLHWSFRAADRRIVRTFHTKALECGASDAGSPGLRPDYTGEFYGAFVFDPDGYKIEAVCRTST